MTDLQDDRLSTRLAASEARIQVPSSPPDVSRVSGVPFLRAGLLMATVGSALIATVLLVGQLTDRTQGDASPSPGTGVSAQARQGDFVLTLSSPRSTWTSDESIEVMATLAYVGEDAEATIGGGGGPVVFSLRQLSGGSAVLEGGQNIPCIRYQLRPGAPLVWSFAKAGEVQEEPPFDLAFFQDPRLQLPAGRWEIRATLMYGIGGCALGGENQVLDVVIELEVLQATATAEPTVPELSASPTPSVAPSPTPPSGPFGAEWSPVEIPGTDVAVQSVLRLDAGRLIAAGRDGVEAAAWVSDDQGETWQRAVIDSTRDQDERTSFAEVVEIDGALVGVGWWGGTQSDQFAWVTWRSTDGGLTWTEERDVSQFYAMRSAIVHEGTVFGIGWTYAGTTPFDSWVASSEDGLTWRRINPDSMARSQVNAISSAGERLVAVGFEWTVGGQGPAAARAWLSDDDGASWRAIPLGSFGGASEAYVNDVIVRLDGSLVAVGISVETDTSIPTAWVSRDAGETWRAENMGADGSATAIAEIGRGLVAVGPLDTFGSGTVATYTSEDGTLWATSEPVTEEERYALTAVGDGSRVIVGLACAFQDPCPGALVFGAAHELER